MNASLEKLASPGSPMSPTHCPYRQVARLHQALSPDKMRVGFFLGAGCAVSIRVAGDGGTVPLIPDITGLTEIVRRKMTSSATHKGPFESVVSQIEDGTTKTATVEEILTRVRNLLDVVGEKAFDGLRKKDLAALDKVLCEEISNVMKARLPSSGSPYHQLASWIGSIPRAHPVEIFTSNYDLLMEQALEEHSVPYYDGFSGSDRTFFDEASMEQHERLPPRWARLWKLHGSINWWLDKRRDVQRRERGETDAQQMIHPTHLKFDQSRMMPYLAMMDRLRAFLSNGQAVLVVCGYSFSDWHLNHAILSGLSGNPSSVCFGLVHGDRAPAVKSILPFGIPGNLRLLALDGGVLGTVDQNWHSQQISEHEFHGRAVCQGPVGTPTTSEDERSKLLLGDFVVLGTFLASHLARFGQGDEHAP